MVEKVVKKIDRFSIIRELGKGAQGVVHLAVDPILQRNVAIKTLHIANTSNASDTKQELLKEARTISKMVHPNIVSIYEAGEDKEHNPYLVFEYVSGQLLSVIMKQQGAMSVNDTLNLLKPAIEAISIANQKNIIHCDLKPDNILISDNNTVKVMDFGIARILSEQKTITNGFFGTPRYMTPEYIHNQSISANNDAYALGIILYEMLTGKSAFKSKTLKQTINKVINEALTAPSQFNSKINTQLESIILKATDKKSENRYQSSSELNQALDDYLEHQSISLSQSRSKQDVTIQFLLRRMQKKQDFPALSESLFKINKIVEEDNNGFDQLAGAIVDDFALTNKILKIVNSAYYRRSGGEVKTISRAVMMLGFDAIRSIAISLILIEHLHNKTQAKQLKDQVIACLYSGIFAKNLAEKMSIANKEEVFLSGIFHNLGKLLCIFYFNEESLEIEQLVNDKNLSEANAATQVLGVTYSFLGIAIAKQWDLPHYIVSTISPFNTKASRKRKHLHNDEKIHAVSSLSNELTALIEKNQDSDWRVKSVQLWRKYTPQLELNDADLIELADQAKEDLVELNSILNINMSKSSIITNLNDDEEDKDDHREICATDTEQKLLLDSADESEEVVNKETENVDPQSILKAGIDDIKALLEEVYSTSDVFRLCMETMQRAFKFDHAIVCIANNQSNKMEAKFGYGISNAFLKQFHFPLKHQLDVFHLSLDKDIDICISDASNINIIKKIPAWYRQLIDAKSFIILPIVIKNKPIGLFYGDRFQANELQIEPHELKLLQKLKQLATTALTKKKHP